MQVNAWLTAPSLRPKNPDPARGPLASSFGHSRLAFCAFCVAWWYNGQGVGLRLERSRVQLPAVPLSGNDLRQVVHTHVPLSSSSTIWYQSPAAMSGDWEGNRRSGVVLAMRHRLVLTWPLLAQL